MKISNGTRFEVRQHTTPDPEGDYVVLNDQDGNPMSYKTYAEALSELELETDSASAYIAIITTVGVFFS